MSNPAGWVVLAVGLTASIVVGYGTSKGVEKVYDWIPFLKTKRIPKKEGWSRPEVSNSTVDNDSWYAGESRCYSS